MAGNDSSALICLVAVISADLPLVVWVGSGDLILSHCDSMEEDEIKLSDLVALVFGHRDQPNRRVGHWIKRGHSKKVTSNFEPKNTVTESVSEVIDPRQNYVVTWPVNSGPDCVTNNNLLIQYIA